MDWNTRFRGLCWPMLAYFLVYFAEFGKDEDRRDYEVDYSRIRSTGFEVSVDIEMGLSELIDGLKLLEIRNPYGNV